MMKRRPPRIGFTLLEILIAIAIISSAGLKRLVGIMCFHNLSKPLIQISWFFYHFLFLVARYSLLTSFRITRPISG